MKYICGSSLENYSSNNTRQHDTTRDNTSTTRDNTGTIQHNTSVTRPNTSTKEALAAKIGLYFALIVAELQLKIVKIVLNVILFLSFEYQRLIILPSEILSNQAHMTSCAKLSSLLYIKLKIAIQVPKTYIYPLFRVLSTTTMASEN